MEFTTPVARCPNVFIVGAPNCGTTSLFSLLTGHPQVFMPALKEPHYFSSARPTSHLRYPLTVVRDKGSYLKLFNRSAGHKIIVDASTSYLWDRDASHRIYSASPNAKILILLRDPVERAHSQYLMNFREGWQDLPFYETLQADSQLEREYGMALLYVELGLYHEQVKRYFEIFGSHRVKVVLTESLRKVEESKRKNTLTDVFRFLDLDLDHLDAADASCDENQHGTIRSNWARRIAGWRWPRRLAQMRFCQRFGSTYAIRRRIFEPLFVKPGPRPPMDPRAKRWLCEIYEPDVSALERFLGRCMPELRRSW